MYCRNLIFGLGFVSVIVCCYGQGGGGGRPDVNTPSGRMEYLKKYGHLGSGYPDRTAPTDLTDDEQLREGIKSFQRTAGLEATGEVDEKTLEYMSYDRCGVKDVVDVATNRKKRYTEQGSKWPTNRLTYAIKQYPMDADLTVDEVDSEVSRAFKLWSDVTSLEFEKVDWNQSHDINISFTPRVHGDGSDFDGPGGTLAHAYFPQFGGDVHMDEDETWTKDSNLGTNFFQVVAHEFGHSLGLSHSNVTDALMNAFYRGYKDNFKLNQDDIDGIQSIYGKPVDGFWEEWTEWSQCSKTCGDGTKTRSRGCNEPERGGRNCEGKSTEPESCNHRPCPEWGEWNECSLEKVYTRTQNCDGSNIDNCNDMEFNFNGTCNNQAHKSAWDNWSLWTACSQTCIPEGSDKQGTRVRVRDCRFNEHRISCVGEYVETETCGDEHCSVDGYWEEWQKWSPCSETCGNETKTRWRRCNEPKHGGRHCEGKRTETESCNHHPCPGWSAWGLWGECNRTCGGGIRERTRTCGNSARQPCKGRGSKREYCNTQRCPVDGKWSEWSEWGVSGCRNSRYCTRFRNSTAGREKRQRTCTRPQYNGRECEGNRVEWKPCYQTCYLKFGYGTWSEWGPWSPCYVDKATGTGTRERERKCTGAWAKEGSEGDKRECPMYKTYNEILDNKKKLLPNVSPEDLDEEIKEILKNFDLGNYDEVDEQFFNSTDKQIEKECTVMTEEDESGSGSGAGCMDGDDDCEGSSSGSGHEAVDE